jgi:GTP-binding protein HflX
MFNKMYKTEDDIQKVLLIGIQLPQLSDSEVQSSLDELSRLVTTLGYKPVARTTQKRKSDKNKSVLGEGKLKEVAQYTGGQGVIAASFVKKKTKAALKFDQTEEDSDEETEIDEIETEEDEIVESTPFLEIKEKVDLVVFDCELTPSQLRNLESALGCDVLDRTGVIIEIFSRHAKTKAARLQVEIAKLTYVAPRIRETGGSSERSGGGVGGRGAGESSLELDRRKIRDRIKELKTELASIDSEHLTRRSRRDQEIKVALVGYTNAGKSSLMRAMTGSEVLVADKLFATLDTTTRPMHPESMPKILFSDTVGFIKKLPHDLVASFKSTLDEALNATLLLYVVDSSDPTFRAQLQVTKTVLAEVGVASDTPNILILNKIDRLSPEQLLELKTEFPEAIALSTRSGEDLQMLRDFLIKHFEEEMIETDFLVSYALKGAVGEIRSRLRVLSEDHNEKGFLFKVRGKEKDINQIKAKFRI